MALLSVRTSSTNPLPGEGFVGGEAEIRDLYLATRALSEQLCQPLLVEDYGLQAMPSTSPAKWHLAHTSWFFETFILKPFCPGYRVCHAQFEVLFNSYYNGIGKQYPRAERGLLSRPSVAEVYAYRAHVDAAMLELLDAVPMEAELEIVQRTELGCNHEQQHQELFLTDLKYCWFRNPMYPVYCDRPLPVAAPPAAIRWQSVNSGLYDIGHEVKDGFSFDNELPRHPQYVSDFRIADRLVSNGEYAQFIRDDGYSRPDLWLADGWGELQDRARSDAPLAPLYWVAQGEDWLEYTLHGLLPLNPHRPVSHLSAYEADAYARWAGCRLPTEFEWEVAVQQSTTSRQRINSVGQFLDSQLFLPVFADTAASLDNCMGRLWQWTSSAYSPYPGFSTPPGAVGEYNGKFMANQLVLRGGSCATSQVHYRHSYRNFFYPGDQWQFTGLRLAQNV